MDSKPFFEEVYGARSFSNCGSQYMSPIPATSFSLFGYPQPAGDTYPGPVLGVKDETMLYDEPSYFGSPDYVASPFSGEPESPFLPQKYPGTAWPPHTPSAELYGRNYLSFPSTESSSLGLQLQPFSSGPELSLLHHTVSPQEVLSTPSPPALSLSPSSLSSPLAPPSPSVENAAIVPSQDERSPLLRIRIPASGDRQLRPQVRANRSFSEEPRPLAVPATPVPIGTGGGRQPRGRVMRTISDPMPVPNLTKKSRGRRVPTTDGPAIPTNDSGKPRLFVCEVPDCGKCFQRSEHLKRHVRSIHTYDKPFACDFPHCSAKFARRDNLAQHRSIHSSRSAPRSSGFDD